MGFCSAASCSSFCSNSCSRRWSCDVELIFVLLCVSFARRWGFWRLDGICFFDALCWQEVQILVLWTFVRSPWIAPVVPFFQDTPYIQVLHVYIFHKLGQPSSVLAPYEKAYERPMKIGNDSCLWNLAVALATRSWWDCTQYDNRCLDYFYPFEWMFPVFNFDNSSSAHNTLGATASCLNVDLDSLESQHQHAEQYFGSRSSCWIDAASSNACVYYHVAFGCCSSGACLSEIGWCFSCLCSCFHLFHRVVLHDLLLDACSLRLLSSLEDGDIDLHLVFCHITVYWTLRSNLCRNRVLRVRTAVCYPFVLSGEWMAALPTACLKVTILGGRSLEPPGLNQLLNNPLVYYLLALGSFPKSMSSSIFSVLGPLVQIIDSTTASFPNVWHSLLSSLVLSSQSPGSFAVYLLSFQALVLSSSLDVVVSSWSIQTLSCQQLQATSPIIWHPSTSSLPHSTSSSQPAPHVGFSLHSTPEQLHSPPPTSKNDDQPPSLDPQAHQHSVVSFWSMQQILHWLPCHYNALLGLSTKAAVCWREWWSLAVRMLAWMCRFGFCFGRWCLVFVSCDGWLSRCRDGLCLLDLGWCLVHLVGCICSFCYREGDLFETEVQLLELELVRLTWAAQVHFMSSSSCFSPWHWRFSFLQCFSQLPSSFRLTLLGFLSLNWNSRKFYFGSYLALILNAHLLMSLWVEATFSLILTQVKWF